ncbi:pulmonary surfactant-associated protein C-like isoform X2 [Hemicordylus capensis]|uniref:pulmonary surfactant-associated protein C-like isoform X2 n=1 Tax=Hemicordylus capensis TaxID=884348 RepID=UPI002302F50D|nr:pulmonary surfactant-associated protein C-like isoform X2 [Hemicordylus capensis]
MQTSSKEALLAEAPPDYSASPRLPGLPCKKMLIVVVVVVVIVLVVLGFLLMGLHISEKHTETVLQMTIQGLDGKTSPQHLSMSRKEQVATFQVNGNLNSSATVVYDYSNTKLLKPSLKQSEEEGGHPAPLADRSALGTTLNILCSHLPVYWA